MHLTYDLKVGYSCDHNCAHCVIQDSKSDLVRKGLAVDLTSDECKELIRMAKRRGVLSITLTGGEPTIRKDFADLVHLCLEYGMRISLQTNGGHLYEPHILDIVQSTDLITYVVALHGTTPEVHDAITRTPGSFTNTVKGIDAVLTQGKNLVLKTVISKINQRQLPAFIPFMKERGIRDINMAFPHAQGAARENFDLVVPTYTELRPYILEAAQKAKSEDINLTFETIPFCILPEYPEMASELIYSFKAVECNQVREERFDWNKVRRAIKEKKVCCGTCFFYQYCEGPWSEYVARFGFTEFLPIHVKQ